MIKRLILFLVLIAFYAGPVFSGGDPDSKRQKPMAAKSMEKPAMTEQSMEPKPVEPPVEKMGPMVTEVMLPEHTPPELAPPKMKEVQTGSVRFESDPTSADVEVNGLYVGSTPIQIPLRVGGVHFVRILTPGFLNWETRIKAYNGLEVVAKLSKEISRTEETKITTGAQ